MIDVVIIDDEVWVAKMITQIIDWGAYGFRIAGIFHDGEEGLDGIRRLHPRLVLTDIRMPGLTGLDLIQTLSEESPDIMFVIISGYNDFEYAKSALTYGAIGYLLKPIDETELKKSGAESKKATCFRRVEAAFGIADTGHHGPYGGKTSGAVLYQFHFGTG